MHATDDSERLIHAPAAEDDKVEHAVLDHLLALHPTQLTLAELTREMAPAEPDFAHADAIERAVRELSGVGLLHREGKTVRPTRAALRFAELND